MHRARSFVSTSITGGYVYRGARLKDLVGAYIYGDYDTGKIWGLRYEGDRVVWHKELVDSNLRLVSFGEDAQGELYLVNHMGGRSTASPPTCLRRRSPISRAN